MLNISKYCLLFWMSAMIILADSADEWTKVQILKPEPTAKDDAVIIRVAVVGSKGKSTLISSGTDTVYDHGQKMVENEKMMKYIELSALDKNACCDLFKEIAYECYKAPSPTPAASNCCCTASNKA